MDVTLFVSIQGGELKIHAVSLPIQADTIYSISAKKLFLIQFFSPHGNGQTLRICVDWLGFRVLYDQVDLSEPGS